MQLSQRVESRGQGRPVASSRKSPRQPSAARKRKQRELNGRVVTPPLIKTTGPHAKTAPRIAAATGDSARRSRQTRAKKIKEGGEGTPTNIPDIAWALICIQIASYCDGRDRGNTWTVVTKSNTENASNQKHCGGQHESSSGRTNTNPPPRLHQQRQSDTLCLRVPGGSAKRSQAGKVGDPGGKSAEGHIRRALTPIPTNEMGPHTRRQVRDVMIRVKRKRKQLDKIGALKLCGEGELCVPLAFCKEEKETMTGLHETEPQEKSRRIRPPKQERKATMQTQPHTIRKGSAESQNQRRRRTAPADRGPGQLSHPANDKKVETGTEQ